MVEISGRCFLFCMNKTLWNDDICMQDSSLPDVPKGSGGSLDICQHFTERESIQAYRKGIVRDCAQCRSLLQPLAKHLHSRHLCSAELYLGWYGEQRCE